MFEVLKMACPYGDEKWETNLKVLDKYEIRTAENWLELEKTDKEQLKVDGLPTSVINSINRTVHVGLLLPEFKYADKASFLKTNGHTDKHQEAHTIYEHAVGVDNLWVLNKTDCNFLCESYQEMVELTQKYLLKCFSDEAYGGKKGIINPYPRTHELLALHDIIRDDCPDVTPPVCSESSLKRITECGEESKYTKARISCSAFYEYANHHVDPYLFHMWNTIEHNAPTRQNFDLFCGVKFQAIEDYHKGLD